MRTVVSHPASRATSPEEPRLGASPAAQVPYPADIDLEAMESEARRKMGEMAYAYYAGGAEDEHLLAENVAAWRRWQLVPRVLVDVSIVDTATTVLGSPVTHPVMIAPTAIQRIAHPDGEAAMARGAASAGTCLVLSSLSTQSLEHVAAAAPDALRWMQVYVLRDRERTVELVARAVEAGYRALVLTVDAPVSGLRRRELRGGVHLPEDLTLPNLSGASTDSAHAGGFMSVVAREFDPALTYDDIGWLAGLSDLPVVVKGVRRVDDAARCLAAGASALAVSNHGGRQLDDERPTADVLAEIVDSVADAGEVYVDGGLRRAADVAKALSIGARAVMIGRPTLWALATDGEDGVAALLRWLEGELRRVMALVGAPDLSALDRSLVCREAAR